MSRVCVYGCLAVGLGIAILVGMWPCMYVDVNKCNVCFVCMFLIWGFGFTVSYCEGIGSEPFFFFQVLISFDSGELATTHSSIKPKTPLSPLFTLTNMCIGFQLAVVI